MPDAALDALYQMGGLHRVELNVGAVLASGDREVVATRVAEEVARALDDSDVIVATSRELVVGDGPQESLEIARSISRALVAAVKALPARARPAWIVAKGGITSSDIATGAVEVQPAWVRGTLLPGIISIWQPVGGSMAGLVYVVFAGNVGDDDALAAVVARLSQVA